ncbi:hypothetical protein L195_g040742 [Trifolium pratense]|uniref:Uncharacterized protein n=1 Tax=Trifolium pratense TaxID=57577 RepID=A0A2K3M1K7_TRIPR|nr:hypothetical protein L195_g040742 [Trifolium pratense]
MLKEVVAGVFGNSCARGAWHRWLTIPRFGFQWVLGCFNKICIIEGWRFWGLSQYRYLTAV